MDTLSYQSDGCFLALRSLCQSHYGLNILVMEMRVSGIKDQRAMGGSVFEGEFDRAGSEEHDSLGC